MLSERMTDDQAKKTPWHLKAFGALAGAIFGVALAATLTYLFSLGTIATVMTFMVVIGVGICWGFVFHNVATTLFELIGILR